MEVEHDVMAEHHTRSAGVLLHVTSLPNAYGIGDLGPAAHRWVDRLADAKQTWWQTLPLNPPDGSDSPYSASSSVAGNALLVSPEACAADGLLSRGELASLRLDAGNRVDFARVRRSKAAMFDRIAAHFAKRRGAMCAAYDRFITEQAAWLGDYALFAALRERSPGTMWTDWSTDLKSRKPAAIASARRDVAAAFERHRVAQFLFDRQMRALRDHARRRGVRILGDVPIYLSHDSADCWTRPELFQLDTRGRPTAVAGVPPDLFSADGQRWGNPLYDWKVHETDGFRWWVERIRAALGHADVIRIDHFRALAAYWRVPASAPTAKTGRWVRTPGEALLQTLHDTFGKLPLVAEDLGVITPDVEELRDRWKLPGMLIVQFGFGGDVSNTNLIHHARRNQIAYPGTHDNDTCVGWWRSADRATRRHAEQYAPGIGANPAGTMIRLAMASVAEKCIVQAQDVLGLDARSRMNLPGEAGPRNWTWRMSERALRDAGWKRLATLTETYGRAVKPNQNGKL